MLSEAGRVIPNGMDKLKLIILVFFIFGVVASANAQKDLQVEKKPIPTTLQKALGLYIDYYETSNWENVYGLLKDPKETKEQFIDRMTKPRGKAIRSRFSKVLAIKPSTEMVYFPPAKTWDVSVCSLVQTTRGNKWVSGTISVYDSDAGWRFSQLLISLTINGRLDPCRAI